MISLARVEMGGSITADSATLTIRTKSSRAPLLKRFYRHNFSSVLPACLSTSGRTHGEFLRLVFFLADKKADDYFEALRYQPHKQ